MCSQQWTLLHVLVPEGYFETAHDWHSACEAQNHEVNRLLRDDRAEAGKEDVLFGLFDEVKCSPFWRFRRFQYSTDAYLLVLLFALWNCSCRL